ncbi:OsmC family protein [Candidatus Halobeggiatoa sp. HSG11]|nr:OsmC family protein [Candidatus Halobeggiatoa sp. HSG11]
MDATITFGAGMQVNAQFGNFTVNTDQAKKAGGQETFPDPFSYFLSSLGTCAGYFILRFCQSRNISTEGIKLHQSNDWNAGRVENIHIEIELPPSFPEKYATALIRATNECTVKKTLMNPPEIEVTIK